MRIITISLLQQLIFNYGSYAFQKNDVELKSDFAALNDDNVFDLWQANDCGDILGKKRPIHGGENWTLIREAYEKVAGSKSTFSQPSSSDINGFNVKHSANYNDDNERGIFANQKIRKSQVVYEHMWLGSFPDSKSFIDVLDLLPKGFICDLITWGYNFEEDYNWISIDFDDMSYLSGKGTQNIQYNEANLELVALRDIEAGEELICNDGEDVDDENVDDEYVGDKNLDVFDIKINNNLIPVNNSEIHVKIFDPKSKFSALENHDVFELWNVNDCGDLINKRRPIHERKTWFLIEETYEKVTGIKSTLNQTSSSDNGFRIKFSVNYSNSNERSLFAVENINNTQQVYYHERQGSFPDSGSFIKFLHLLPIDLICDAISWAYSIDNYDSFVTIDFDEMSYCVGEGKPNIDYSGDIIVAQRNIEVGEELICNNGDDDSTDNDDYDLGSGYDLLLSLNKCDTNSSKKRPILGKPSWNLMERIYEEVVGSNSTIKGSSGSNGLRFKYSVKYTEHMGRGLFAEERIPKGQLMYEHIKMAYFPDQDTLAEFLNRLISYEHKSTSDNHPDPEPYLDFLNRFPKGLACDISMWLAEDDWEGVSVSDRVGIGASMDFDDGSYCNNGGDHKKNMDYSENDNDNLKMYALRDIDEGEEILCSYSMS